MVEFSSVHMNQNTWVILNMASSLIKQRQFYAWKPHLLYQGIISTISISACHELWLKLIFTFMKFSGAVIADEGTTAGIAGANKVK